MNWIASLLLTSSCASIALAANQAELKVQVGHSGPISSVAFLAGSRQVLTQGPDGTVRLWDVATGRDFRVYETRVLGLSAVPSHKGHWILTSGSTTKLFDINTGKEIQSFKIASVSVAFSPDDRLVLTGGNDGDYGIAVLWNVSTGKEVQRFVGHKHQVNCVRFSPNGREIFTAAFDGTTRIWDIEMGREVRRFATSSGTTLAISPDGRQIINSRRWRYGATLGDI